MSRIGKKKILLNERTKLTFENNQVLVEGPKGKLNLSVPTNVVIEKEDSGVLVKITRGDKVSISKMQGLYRALIQNMVIGVNVGYKKNLELVGVGYRVAAKGKDLIFTLGFSHEVKIDAPSGITFTVDGQTKFCVEGTEKSLVGQIAAKIRDLRPPDSYKGKGIRYAGEIVRTKAGKSVKK